MGGSGGVEFRQYYRAVVKRLWLVLLLMAVIAGGVYWRTTSQPPTYAANARLILSTSSLLAIPTNSTNVASTSSTNSSRDSNPTTAAIAVITSRPIAERVAREVGIKDVSAVRGAISAEKVSGTSMIDITARTGERELAAKVANATARQFVLFFTELNRKNYRDMRVFIESELGRARDRLEASDRQIQRVKERNAFVDLSSAISQASEELADTRGLMDETRLALRENAAKLSAASARLAKEKITRVYSTEIEDNPVFDALRDRLTGLEIERAELSQRYTARHPKMIQLQDSIASLKRELAQVSRTIVGRETTSTNPIYDQMLTQVVTLQVDQAAAAARLAALGTSLRVKQASLAAFPAMERTLNALVRENEILKETYSLLAEQRQEALLRENEAGYVPAGAQVLEPAIVPAAPVQADVPLRTGAGALVGLLLGVIAAVVMESSDDKIRSAQDAERTLGAPVLVQVPDMAPQRVVPGGTVFLIALFLTVMLGGTLMVARISTEATVHNNSALSVFARLGQSLDGLTARVSQVIR